MVKKLSKKANIISILVLTVSAIGILTSSAAFASITHFCR